MPEQIEHTPVLCGLATNPSLPPELVDVLIRDGDDEILTDLVERTDLTRAQTMSLVARCDPRMIALLVRHALAEAEPRHFDDPAIAIQLISCGLGTPEILARLAHGPDPAVRRLVADEVTPLPDETTRIFAADTDIRLVAAVAGWGELPADVARALARHPDREVRSELASNPSGTVPPDVLVELLTTGGDAPITTCGVCRANPSPDERCHIDRLDVTPDTVDSSSAVTYQAESSANTRSGTASLLSDASAVGGNAVGWIGNGSAHTLTFHVTAPGSGSYALAVTYANNDRASSSNYNENLIDRAATITTSGGTNETVYFRNTYSWHQYWTVDTTVQLNAGANTVTFANPTAYAPDSTRSPSPRSASADPLPRADWGSALALQNRELVAEQEDLGVLPGRWMSGRS